MGDVCSLRNGLEIVAGGIEDWRGLARYHYRCDEPATIWKVFAIKRNSRGDSRGIERLVGSDARAIGVIVYGMPVASVHLRNVATGGRYVGWSDRAMALRLLNLEMRTISRVVIRPEYRGIGLGSWLVANTLELAGTVMVEAMAAMGRVNPFFERAGMVRYESGLAGGSVRMVEAFEQMRIGRELLGDRGKLLGAIRRLKVEQLQWLVNEMRRFVQRYGRKRADIKGLRNWRAGVDSVDELMAYVELVVAHVFCNPVYYLWKRPLII